jgi:hypothetical protein
MQIAPFFASRVVNVVVATAFLGLAACTPVVGIEDAAAVGDSSGTPSLSDADAGDADAAVDSSTPDISDPGITFADETQAAATSLNPARLVTDPSNGQQYIEVPYTASGIAHFRLTFVVAGEGATYNAEIIGGGTNWAAPIVSPTGTPDVAAGSSAAPLNVLLSLLVQAPAGGGHPEAAVLKLNAARTGTTLDSFILVNIRGY